MKPEETRRPAPSVGWPTQATPETIGPGGGPQDWLDRIAADWDDGVASHPSGGVDSSFLFRRADTPEGLGSSQDTLPARGWTPDFGAARPRFRVLRAHAKGGLGEVVLAQDEELGRVVALKSLQGRFADDPQSRARFLHEAELTGRLEHPGIVPIYALGNQADGRPFYAMRFIEGESLRDAIVRFHGGGDDVALLGGALALRQLIERFLHVCDAIEYAHSRGIVHRDLKPDNVMLGSYGETIVVDWGLAGRLRTADIPPIGITTSVVGPNDGTLANWTFGTPQYMSPQQAAGEPSPCRASDVYSLGATLYHLLTGRAPFDGPDVARVLEKAREGSFTPPRAVEPRIAKALEAICLKAMAPLPEGRYSGAQGLGDDLRKWLADEPVSAWREPWPIQARRHLTRHRSPVMALAAGLTVAAIAIGFLFHHLGLAAEQRRSRVHSLVYALESAETREVPRILRELRPDLGLALGSLRAMSRLSASDPEGRRRRLHAELALLSSDRSRSARLLDLLLQAETGPDEVEVICTSLQTMGSPIVAMPRLWAMVSPFPEKLDDVQLRATAALAIFCPGDPRWSRLSAPVAARLAQQGPLLIAAWGDAFPRVAPGLEGPLRDIYGDRDPARQRERSMAFALLFSFGSRRSDPRRSESLAELIGDAEPDQLRLIRNAITDPGRAVARLEKSLDRPAIGDEPETRRQGQIAAALVTMGMPDRAFALLRQDEDPSLRSELLHALPKLSADPRLLASRLLVEGDITARRALVLALGGYKAADLPPDAARPLLASLLMSFRDDPDPGLHSAIDWLLRRWGHADAADRVDAESAGRGIDEIRGWYVNALGQTLSITVGPAEFLMGAPADDPDRQLDEVQARVRIDRSFAVSTREVTVAQFREFAEQTPGVRRIYEHPMIQQYVPTSDCAVGGVDWIDAIRFCNWLSRRDGIPEDQWCYPEPFGIGATLPSDLLDRVGYRLPTEAEWEFACRGGSGRPRHFGGSDWLAMHYAWSVENAEGRLHPPGLLKPNDFGLFDTMGNASEWIEDARVDPYTLIPRPHPFVDEMTDRRVEPLTSRMIRGGSSDGPSISMRSAYRNYWDVPTGRYPQYGFRVARTIRRGEGARPGNRDPASDPRARVAR